MNVAKRLPSPSCVPSSPFSINSELALSPQQNNTSLVSPPQTPPRGRRPSVPIPMAWLGRSSTTTSSQSAPYTASKPIRISEPKFNNSLEMFNVPRVGALGTGATVVKTPQDALASATGQLFRLPDEEEDEDFEAKYEKRLPSPPKSPVLPSVPASKSSPNLVSREGSVPPRPVRPPPPVPTASAPAILRPSLKNRSPLPSGFYPPVPALPSNIAATPPQSPFECILLSPVPACAIDPSKIIITLETSTATYRTTLKTLSSRPSYLSAYLTSLFPQNSSAASVYSHASDLSSDPNEDGFSAIFHEHLTIAGLLPQSSTNLHIFLDRPSAPYAHILNYLRLPSSTAENPATLPHAARLTSLSPSRLEALLELRDEARFLDLEELYGLCMDEIRQRQAFGMHARERSGSSHSSIHSLQTFQDRITDNSDSTGSRSSGSDMGPSTSSCSFSRERTPIRKDSSPLKSRPPPAGWI